MQLCNIRFLNNDISFLSFWGSTHLPGRLCNNCIMCQYIVMPYSDGHSECFHSFAVTVLQQHPHAIFFWYSFIFFFKFIYLFFLILKSLILTCVPKHEPPPTSLPITSLWVIPMHQPQACCILRQT